MNPAFFFITNSCLEFWFWNSCDAFIHIKKQISYRFRNYFLYINDNNWFCFKTPCLFCLKILLLFFFFHDFTKKFPKKFILHFFLPLT